MRTAVLSWATFTLLVSDFNATRTYLRAGRDCISVDLLDIQSLSPFANRGLRSALTWMIYLVIFSLFWLGENTAPRQNFSIFITLLTVATAGFVVPLLGVHHKIESVKRLELDRLRDAIRVERPAVIDKHLDESPASPKLANLIAYYTLIERTREWPVDGANLLKFFMYLLIGLGSWLGGALVELVLARSLGG